MKKNTYNIHYKNLFKQKHLQVFHKSWELLQINKCTFWPATNLNPKNHQHIPTLMCTCTHTHTHTHTRTQWCIKNLNQKDSDISITVCNLYRTCYELRTVKLTWKISWSLWQQRHLYLLSDVNTVNRLREKNL